MSEAARSSAALPIDASKARLRLWLRILGVSRLIETELRERLRSRFDTTLPRFDVLSVLYRSAEGLRMSELSNALRVSNGNITGIVDRLAADRLVVRVPVEGDRRAMTVRLTAEGKQSFEKLAAAHEAWVDELLDSVTPAEANWLNTRLQAVRERVKAKEA
jgi:DNA-binding MarR family transcriptional regulator